MANRLLRVLAVRVQQCRASPLVTRHLAGNRNHLGDIPSRSFGYKKEWHFETDKKILIFFNKTFPLPNKNIWTDFRLKYAVGMKVSQELLMQGSSMAEWRQLPRLGARYGKIGRPTAKITVALHTWTADLLKKWPELHFKKASQRWPCGNRSWRYCHADQFGQGRKTPAPTRK